MKEKKMNIWYCYIAALIGQIYKHFIIFEILLLLTDIPKETKQALDDVFGKYT